MSSYRIRYLVSLLGLLGFALVIFVRAVWIQVIGEERLSNLAERQFYRKALVRPRRGSILDRNGQELAISVETKSLAANPRKLSMSQDFLTSFSKVVGTPKRRLKKKLSSERSFVWIKRHLNDSQIEQVEKLKLPKGVWTVTESKRVYPHAELAGQVIGSVNIDLDGLEGVELWKNETLKGRVFSINAVKDALGRPTFIDAKMDRLMANGSSVNLTIDAALQFVVEEELKRHVVKTGSQSGMVVVMDAQTGELLSVANVPTFDLNNRKTSQYARRNRVFVDGFEPGSTMKPLLVLAALREGWKPSSLVWGGRGQVRIQGRVISEAEADEKFEWLTLQDVIRVSSNVGSAKIAIKLGKEKFVEALRDFGFGAKSGAGFPGEISGMLSKPEKVRQIRLATMGFGQGLLVTPIQMVRAYASILNGGWLVQPKLILKENGGYPPRRLFDEEVAHPVVEALLSVTSEEGTGKEARLEGYSVAGKTGTAQVIDPRTKRYSRTHYISSFIGFPVEVEKKVVVFVALDRPRGNYYAASTAAPLFKDILKAVVNRFEMPIQVNPGLKARKILALEKKPVDRIKWSLSQRIDRLRILDGIDENGRKVWTMPNLKGLSIREALKSLEGYSFELKVRGDGLVNGQKPRPGEKVKDGRTVEIFLETS